MKCLIIAAGKGQRLSKKGNSKPLVPFLGISLIERVIFTAKKAGLTDFYVVTGYNGEKVRQFLDKFSRTNNIKISHIVNGEWEKENGVSVLKAKNAINESFILLMADHIFDYNILKKLKNVQIQNNEIVLAVDHNTDSQSLIDINDVTKVVVNDNKVVDIGKNIIKNNGYDTGMFLCSPAIFSAIETSITKNNDASLSGGVKVLAKKGKVRAFDIKDSFWIDIDDERSFQKAERCLLDKLKKSSDGPVSRYINRPVSAKITRYLLKTNITPNQISLISFIISLVAAAFFFLGNYINLIVGAVLAQTSSIIDGCDGEIARLKYQESDFGKWFDAVLDRYADAFLLFGLTYYTYFINENIMTFFIGFLAIIGSFMNSYTADKYDGLMMRKLGYGRHYFRIGRDVRIFIILLGVVINQPFLILAITALLMNIENIRRIFLLSKNE